MDKVTTNVNYVEIDGKHLIAHLELINANDDQFEISLNSPYAEGAMLDDAIAVIVDVDIIGYDRRDANQEIVVQREEGIELSIDDIEAADIQFDVVHRGALESEPLPMLTDMETMICLGEDAKVVVKFELK